MVLPIGGLNSSSAIGGASVFLTDADMQPKCYGCELKTEIDSALGKVEIDLSQCEAGECKGDLPDCKIEKHCKLSGTITVKIDPGKKGKGDKAKPKHVPVYLHFRHSIPVFPDHWFGKGFYTLTRPRTMKFDIGKDQELKCGDKFVLLNIAIPDVATGSVDKERGIILLCANCPRHKK